MNNMTYKCYNDDNLFYTTEVLYNEKKYYQCIHEYFIKKDFKDNTELLHMNKAKTGSEHYQNINNLYEYVQKQITEGANITKAEKKMNIAARPGIIGEEIISWSESKDGQAVIEKKDVVAKDKRTGKPGWVATKIDEKGNEIVDAHLHLNQWIICDSIFNEKYEAVNEEFGIYKPKSKEQLFIRLKEAIHIMQWGKEWYVDAGGYINITDNNDYYVISNRDFSDTYKIVQ